mmetsp:Transcript_13147/g.30333  ORF Transcript_13147/g.30333 Transcript_13147/m.30333 type:complete len:441 (-) Transcript_13147:1647-2969(-)
MCGDRYLGEGALSRVRSRLGQSGVHTVITELNELGLMYARAVRQVKSSRHGGQRNNKPERPVKARVGVSCIHASARVDFQKQVDLVGKLHQMPGIAVGGMDNRDGSSEIKKPDRDEGLAPGLLDGNVKLDDAVIGNDAKNLFTATPSLSGREGSDSLVGLVQRLRQGLQDVVALRSVDVELREVARGRRELRQRGATHGPKPILPNTTVRLVEGCVHRQQASEVLQCGGQQRSGRVPQVPDHRLAVACQVRVPSSVIRLDPQHHVAHRPSLRKLVNENRQREVQREQENWDGVRMCVLPIGFAICFTEMRLQQLHMVMQSERVQVQPLSRNKPSIYSQCPHHSGPEGPRVRHCKSVVLGQSVTAQSERESLTRESKLVDLALELVEVEVLLVVGLVVVVVAYNVHVELDLSGVRRMGLRQSGSDEVSLGGVDDVAKLCEQ